jgi:hypothetical protein
MEKRVMGIFWRPCVGLILFAFTAITAHSQVLTNPGFETAGTNYGFPDVGDGNFGNIPITNIFATGWTPAGFSYVARTGTNSPQSGSYEESSEGYDYVGINNSGSATTAHTGGYALRAFGPFTNGCCLGSGAFQVISSNTVAAVSNNTIWVLSGYVLNWSGDQMSFDNVGLTGFGLLQIAFLDTNGVAIGTPQDGTHYDTNLVLDTWTPTSVTATSPAGTVSIAFYALHVGQNGALGSAFFDDLSITNTGVAPPPPPPPPVVTNQFQAVIQTGNRICFPTISTASYQPQSSDDGSTWANIGLLTPGDGNTDCVFSVTHKFYRVQISQ